MKSFKKSTLLIMTFSIITRLTSFLFKIYLSRRVGAEVPNIWARTIAVERA